MSVYDSKEHKFSITCIFNILGVFTGLHATIKWKNYTRKFLDKVSQEPAATKVKDFDFFI